MPSQERVEPYIEFAGRSKGAIDTESEDIAVNEAQEGHWWSCIRCTAVNSGDAVVCEGCSNPRLLKPELLKREPLKPVPPLTPVAKALMRVGAANGGAAASSGAQAVNSSAPTASSAAPTAKSAAAAASARVKQRMMFEALDGTLYASPQEALQHNGLAAVEQLLQEHFGKGDPAAEWLLQNFPNLHHAYMENSTP